jgi:hypothetical protein
MITKPIPKKLREEMDADPFYHRCCITGVRESSYSKIEWHHAFTWKGERLNEKWCILPVLKWIHDIANRSDIKEMLDRRMLNRADDETLKKYSKAVDLVAKRDRLNKIYGTHEAYHPVLQPHAERSSSSSARSTCKEGRMAF